MTDPLPRDHPGVYVPPPVVYLVPFVVGLLIGRVRPLPIVPVDAPAGVRAAERMGGVALVVAGLALMVWAFVTFWRAKTAIVPIHPATTVVGAGPYRMTRNPMYLGLAMAYVGAALFADALWPLLLLPLAIVTMRFAVIAREERYLEAKFGDEYRRYTARVRRWM